MNGGKAEDIVVEELKYSSSCEHSAERNGYRERSNTDGQVTCFNCRETGHYSFECPRGDASGYPRGRSSSRRGGRGGSRSNSRGGRGRSGSGSRNRHNDRNHDNRSFHDIEQSPLVRDNPLAEFQTLSLSAVSISSVNKKKSVTKRFVPN